MPKTAIKRHKICKYCDKELPNGYELICHIREKHRYRCGECNTFFKNRVSCQEHFDSLHSKNSKIETTVETTVERTIETTVVKKVKRKSGARWCITCARWSQGCYDKGHTTIFRIFRY